MKLGLILQTSVTLTRLHHKLAPQYLSYSRHAALVTSICMTDTIWIPAIQYVKDAEQTSILGFKFQSKIEKRLDTRVMRVGSNTFGDPIFQKGLQN